LAGSPVSAATINQSGYLRCCATRVREDTTLSQIIKTVSDTAATKAPISRIADQVSGVLVPALIAIALLTLAGWLIVGKANTVALDKTGTITEGKPAVTDILPCEISEAFFYNYQFMGIE
jgi:cation transport ATPase